MKYYLGVIKNYTLFSGRARRMEFWMFELFNVLFAILAEILDRIFHTTFTMNGLGLSFGYIYLLYALFMFLPALAVQVRRLHDVNKSGWMILLALIPAVGWIWLLALNSLNKSGWMIFLFLISIVAWIWLLVLFFTDGTFGVNKYGPNPKGVGNDQFDSIDA